MSVITGCRSAGLQLSTKALILFLSLVHARLAESYDDANIEDEIGLSTSQVLRLRGYLATDHTVPTQDGYALNLVEAENPLINYDDNPDLENKEPVLFIHGTLVNATCYITDTPAPASPKDYSRYNASQMSQKQIEALYRGSPNADSLVLMLLDFGHKVFLLNRRNTLASQQAYAAKNDESSGSEKSSTESSVLKSLVAPARNFFRSLTKDVGSSYWNFSFDEMVKYDLPDTINYILELTRSPTLVAVGWSSGGAIIEMGLATQPILNEKISKSLLWSPSLYLGHTFQDTVFYRLTEPLTSFYVGAIPPQFLNDIIDFFAVEVCSTNVTQNTICQGILDFIGGYGDGQQRLKPGFFNSFPAPVSSHEFAHLGQESTFDKPRFFDFGWSKNKAVYGSSEPPIYNVSKISSKGLYFWGAEHDALVSIDDVARNVDDLRVPAVFIKLDQPGIFFSHFSYVFHKLKSQLLLIPSLRIIES